MANKLEPIYQTGVKFYSSLTRDQALGKVAIGKDANGLDVFVEPGAVCFVSDTSGNSIFLNNLLFGDGAIASGTTGGIVGGGTGSEGQYVELKLENLQVSTDKTLADYFDEEAFTPEEIYVKNDQGQNVVIINNSGIQVNNQYVATSNWTTNLISTEKLNILNSIDDKIDSVKEYADSLVVSLYKVKGSTDSYASLTKIADPTVGDVYNVSDTNMNYVYTENGWDPLGGSIDFSNFYSKEEVDRLHKTLETALQTYTDGKITAVNVSISNNRDNINTVFQNVNSLTANFDEYKTKVDNNINNITNIASQLTWQ